MLNNVYKTLFTLTRSDKMDFDNFATCRQTILVAFQIFHASCFTKQYFDILKKTSLLSWTINTTVMPLNGITVHGIK